MTTNLERLMGEAARLMRGGSVADATAAIQDALGISTSRGPFPGAARPAATNADAGQVIDVEARVVDDVAGEGTPVPAPASESVPESRSASASRTAKSAGTAPAAERPFAVGRAPSARVASTSAATFTAGSFRNALGARDYKLFEPARDGRPLPLVVMLHGCTQDPDDFARGTGMNELAQAQGFLVLYPAQSQRANTSRCWNWFKHNHQARDRGEPGILAGMVREVIERHGVDPDRVYVAGLSAGGAMAAILGDAYPDVIAAVGVHSGLATGSATDATSAFAAMSGGARPQRRAPQVGATPPTIVFHGDADSTVNVVNAQRVIEAAGLAAGPGTARTRGADGRDFTREIFRDAQGAERAEQWTIHGAGHAWSGGRATGTYADPRGPDASAEMLRFFLAHPRR